MTNLTILAHDLTSRALVFKESYSFEVGQGIEPDISRLRRLGRLGRVKFEFTVQFEAGAVVHAEAQVAQPESIEVYQPTEKRVEASIRHELEKGEAQVAYMKPAAAQQDCLLQCPLTGKRSSGPCIECSDGEYIFQLCC